METSLAILIILFIGYSILAAAAEDYFPEKGKVNLKTQIVDTKEISQDENTKIKEYKINYGNFWTGGSLIVSQEQYNSLNIGDTFCYSLDHDANKKFTNKGECK